MRALWSLVVVVLVAATGAPRVHAASRDATALRAVHHEAAIAPARRTASVARHRIVPLLAVVASSGATFAPPRVKIGEAPGLRAPEVRPHDIARSARGPPHR
jgi:hypothetical protein